MPLRLENRGSRRYYLVWAQYDLFGAVVVRVWGGIGTARGGSKTDAYPSPEAAARGLDQIARRLVARGYEPIAQENSRDE